MWPLLSSLFQSSRPEHSGQVAVPLRAGSAAMAAMVADRPSAGRARPGFGPQAFGKPAQRLDGDALAKVGAVGADLQGQGGTERVFRGLPHAGMVGGQFACRHAVRTCSGLLRFRASFRKRSRACARGDMVRIVEHHARQPGRSAHACAMTVSRSSARSGAAVRTRASASPSEDGPASFIRLRPCRVMAAR